jgi:cell division protein YceG involved in septum cleavage
MSSIRAALAPTPNPYWYFLTTPDGKVIYSTTFAEHVAAKAEYLK